MKPIVRALCVLFAAAALPAIAFAEGPKFEAVLEGGQEVPPVLTSTAGTFEIQFNDDLTAADFELTVLNGTKVLQAHLHCAPAGVNGPVFAFLFGLVPGGFDVNGDLAEFTLTGVNITAAGSSPTGCPASIGMAITSLADIVTAAQQGNIYANVHTTANPGGEIRGQLEED